MKKLNFYIDKDCDICKKGLARLAKLQLFHTGAYMNRQASGKKFRNIVLIPDFNSAGVLTHWHIK